MIMAMIFIVISICGVLQIYLSLKKTKEIKGKILSTNIIASQEVANKKQPFKDSMAGVFIFIEKLHANLIGKKNEHIFKHVAIILVACAAALYVNMEYLNFSNVVITNITLLATIYILYMRQVKKYRREFERDCSEALNIINSAVRVGRPVLQGFEECSRVIDSDFGREFKRILMRLDIGDDPERIFMDSYEKFPYSEYFSFVITVLINMKGGGQVSEVMSRLTMLISASKTLDRKKIAMTAEARMSVKVLVIIPVFFFFFLKFVAPDNFEILIGTDAGKYILYYALTSILIGLFIVWSMMNKVG